MGKILLSCDTNSGNPRDCVEWAVAALCESLDSPTLRILAGLDGELNGFEVRDYMEKALKELGVDLLSGADAASVYARDLAREVIDSNESVSANLKTLSGLYTTYDLDDLRDFYFLHWAFVDLENGDDQHYWEGATKANIEDIVRKKCIQYVG